MVAGAGPAAAAVATVEVAQALAGLTRDQRLGVLKVQVAQLARDSGQPALFLALLHQSLREQMGLSGA
jgi:hypothetical protein